jgi:hypothetical protein
VWRRWITFCAEAGLDSTLSSLSYSGMRPSSSCAPFVPTEWLNGARQEPFLASVRARGFVNCARCRRQQLRRFRSRFERSPVTSKETQLLPTIEPFWGVRQHGPAARTTESLKFLRRFFTFLSPTRKKGLSIDARRRHRARSFLFAMRSCEYTKSVQDGPSE